MGDAYKNLCLGCWHHESNCQCPPSPPPPPPSKFLWEVLVPCQWNDGRPVRTRHHRVWDKRVMELTGGLTVMRPAFGKWVDPREGDVYEERMIPVRVLATEADMEQVVQLTIKHYQQLAVMYFKVSEAARVVDATDKQREKFDRGYFTVASRKIRLGPPKLMRKR